MGESQDSFMQGLHSEKEGKEEREEIYYKRQKVAKD